MLTKHTHNKERGREKSQARERKRARKACLFVCHHKIPPQTAVTKRKGLGTAFVRPLSGLGRISRGRTMLSPESTEQALPSQTQPVHSALLLHTSRLPQHRPQPGDTAEEPRPLPHPNGPGQRSEQELPPRPRGTRGTGSDRGRAPANAPRAQAREARPGPARCAGSVRRARRQPRLTRFSSSAGNLLWNWQRVPPL